MPALEGGAALPVTTGGTGRAEATAAQPVYVVSGGPVIGQRARRVVVVTSGPVKGGAAIPVYDMGAGAIASSEDALPVFVVSGSLGAAAPAFAPTDIAGLQLYFDANAITGLADNDPVSTWADMSGNARNLTQAGGNRPLYKASGGLNNQPYILPDNTDDRMALAASYVTSGPFTFFEVFNYATLSGTGILGFNANNYRRVTITGVGQILIGGTALNLSEAGAFNAATWYIWCIRKDAANNLTIRRNGVNVTSGAPNSANNMTMQYWFAQTVATTSNVSLTASLVYNSALTDAQCLQIETYLTTPHPF